MSKWKTYPLVPDLLPKYSNRDRVRLVSTQHPYNGKEGKIIRVLPAQKSVFYEIQFDGEKYTTSIAERMLVKI